MPGLEKWVSFVPVTIDFLRDAADPWTHIERMAAPPDADRATIERVRVTVPIALPADLTRREGTVVFRVTGYASRAAAAARTKKKHAKAKG